MIDVSFWDPPAGSIPIWDGTPPGFEPAYEVPAPLLTPYLVQNGRVNAAVVVFPGGGYGMRATHEAAPVALWLNSLGVSAFVLNYRVAPYRHPIPLLDARRAVQVVRSRAAEWSVDPQRVGVLGFSAGGHLASSVGTIFDAFPGPQDAVAKESFIPNALVLCYPVISSKEFGHQGSFENLLGPDAPAADRLALSTETRVTPQTPPAFLWHTANDQAVPVLNSLAFASALTGCKVPFELHVFADGEHGLGLAQDHPSAHPWTDLCAKWLRQIGFRRD
jgi:acetyl esterase/lipase